MPETNEVLAHYRLALCFRDHPLLVNQSPERLPVSHRVEALCREANVSCLVDVRHLPPERSLRSLLRPAPRLQDVVTTVWPDGTALGGVLSRQDGEPTPLIEELTALPHVLFWVPRYSIPSLAEVDKRLARKEALGTSALLGDLRRWPEPLPGPADQLPHPATEAMERHETRLREDARFGQLQYDRRVFTADTNSENGDVMPGLEFHYHEHDGLVWAFYEGAGVELGMLVAGKDSHGRLRMAYHHVSDTDQFRTGQCVSYPDIQPDGYLRMHEYWRWSSGDGGTGESQLIEKPGVTIERRVS